MDFVGATFCQFMSNKVCSVFMRTVPLVIRFISFFLNSV